MSAPTRRCASPLTRMPFVADIARSRSDRTDCCRNHHQSWAPASDVTANGECPPHVSLERVLRPSRVDRIPHMPRVVVNVMPKPEILDPQGKAVTGALGRLGFDSMTVRQGKRFEIEVDGDVTAEKLAQIRQAAEHLLANTVIESFEVVEH